MITISSLADLVKEDIYRKSLKTGDRYMTTADVARFLGVSTSMANRTLQLLEKQNVLKRSQRKGSLVAAPIGQHFHPAPEKVKLLLSRDIYLYRPAFYEGIMSGLQKRMGITRPENVGLPPGEEVEVADSLIAESLASHEAVGFVLADTPLLVQRHMANSGLPAAVFGSLHPSVKGLCAVDRDVKSSTRIVRYLYDQGCRHFAVLFLTRIYPADDLFLDRIVATMDELGLPPDALTIRSLPRDAEVCEAHAAGLIETIDKKIGFICNPPLFANAVRQACRAIKGKRRPVIFVNDPDLDRETARDFPRMEMAVPPEEIGEKLGACLLSVSSDAVLRPEEYSIPTTLVLPD